jgi:hypothetical protein
VNICTPFDIHEFVAEAQHVGFLYDVAARAVTRVREENTGLKEAYL